MRRDDRALTIMLSARAHVRAGNQDVAIAVLTQEIESIQLKAKAEKVRDKEYHLEVRQGHSHSRVDVGEKHYHFAGKTRVRMLPIILEGDLPWLR